MAQQSGRIQVFESLTPRQQRSTLVGILVFVAIVMSVINALANGEADWRGLTDSFSTELLGAALTFFIFDLFQERRDDLRLKQRLIREMRSASNATALNAIEELREQGWLEDGSLRKAHLMQANLQLASLIGANLQEASLGDANLYASRLNLANLQRANLWRSNLQGANLRASNLQDASLRGIKFDDKTTLPDDDYFGGSSNSWTTEIDMSRFTGPNHPNFWSSGRKSSPAYRGDAKGDEVE